MLVSDGAAAMLKAGRMLKVCFPTLHVTCLIHACHLVAETIRSKYPRVNDLISSTKKVFVKSPKHIRVFKQLYPQIALPPQPVLTRWGTWIEAVSYYRKYYSQVKDVIFKLNSSNSQAVRESQQLFSDSDVQKEIDDISINYSVVTQTISQLENTHLSIQNLLNNINNLAAALESLTDPIGLDVAQKFRAVLNKNPDLEKVRSISGIQDCTEEIQEYLNFANLTPLDAERSFAKYTRTFSDRRRGLTESHITAMVIDTSIKGSEMEAVIMPSIVNNDELSDEGESINLDLHVSDTEESTECLKKANAEDDDIIESEEAILNKYVENISTEAEKRSTKPNGILEKQNEKYEKCNGIVSPADNFEENDNMNDTFTNDKCQGNLDQTLVNTNDDTQENIKVNSADESSIKGVENIENHEDQDSLNGEAQSAECDSTICHTKTDVDRDTETDSTSIKLPNNKIKKEDDTNIMNTEEMDEKAVDDQKTENEIDDNDDLLCVMEEKSVEEANENKDENSCSASERDDETKEGEENCENANEENAEDIPEEMNDEIHEEKNEENETLDEAREDEEIEDNTESQAELDVDASECAMDIEDSDIGGVVYTDTRILSSEQLDNSSNKIEIDKDANKENEHNGDVTSSDSPVKHASDVDSSLQNGGVENDSEKSIMQGLDEEEKEEAPKRSIKRQLSDLLPENEASKKIKLQMEDTEKPVEKEKRSIKLLDSFNKFMLDKKLKKLTRFELEELCIQKMCECIVNKSEIGELRQKVMIQEQTIDTWRKEAVVVAKQTRDLKIVHERLMADLKIMKEQTGKHLVPVKITRSVGLQAIIEHPSRIRPPLLTNGTTTQPARSPTVNSNQQQTKTVLPPQNRSVIKPKAPPPRMNSANNSRPLQPITQKNNVNNAKPRQTSSSPQQKKSGDPKAVIDLTDEDEKNQNAKQGTAAGPTTVRLLNKQNVGGPPKPASQTPNSQKIMFVAPNVLQRNSAVMVKMNSNGLVSSQNSITTIPNGQVSVVTTPVMRTVPPLKVPVTSVTTVRTTPPAKQIYKHPAPLPAAPNYPIGKRPLPPKPHLNLTRSVCGTGIVLQWKMPYKLEAYETIVSYQLYAYQETKSPPKTDNWGKIGDVKALELPMAVTLTQFAVGNRYFFAVRAVDLQKRLGPFSDPENILL